MRSIPLFIITLSILYSCNNDRIYSESLYGEECNCYKKYYGLRIASGNKTFGRLKSKSICFSKISDSIDGLYDIISADYKYYDSINDLNYSYWR